MLLLKIDLNFWIVKSTLNVCGVNSNRQSLMCPLGKRPPKVKVQHLSQKTKDLLIQRGHFKSKDPSSDANRSQYSKLNKLVKKSSKIDDNNWAIKIATELEEAASKG